MKCLYFKISLFILLTFFAVSPAYALRYDRCESPKVSLPCAAAFEKIRILNNPITKKKFFDDGVHIKDDKLDVIPTYYIAQPDLDGDGVNEIIAALSEDEQSKGTICPSKGLCPHFIIQNRNPDPKKPLLRHFHVIGSAYSFGIGLSTDESVSHYQSLRVYKTNNTEKFNVYQYDKKSDRYYDLGKAGGQK